METIVISKPNEVPDEHLIISKMFDAGLEYFHVRKPYYLRDDMIRYLNAFNPRHLKKLIVHTHHRTVMKFDIRGIHISRKHKRKPLQTITNVKIWRLKYPRLHVSISLHDLADLKGGLMNYNYVFLSPIFDSISKHTYKAAFRMEDLKKAIRSSAKQVMALGGIDEDKIEKVKEIGFDGVAIMGAIWSAKDPLEKFIKIQSLCQTNVQTH